MQSKMSEQREQLEKAYDEMLAHYKALEKWKAEVLDYPKGHIIRQNFDRELDRFDVSYQRYIFLKKQYETNEQ